MGNLASRIELDASTEEWIKKIQDIYTMEYYSAVTKNEIPLGATRMSPEIMMLSKLDKTNIV